MPAILQDGGACECGGAANAVRPRPYRFNSTSVESLSGANALTWLTKGKSKRSVAQLLAAALRSFACGGRHRGS
ncbi:hypothetical protein BSIN_4150 [Burkholderia singularis]|uniref:Uncharacterized protein n=1 Tax=Burkholderia singularis TaxID=1503053 RepID=A0A238H795_9BURK|nr:hypothetical protein BSIN_4150 [Burkholderia singularis]